MHLVSSHNILGSPQSAYPLIHRHAVGVYWLHLGFDDDELTFAQNQIALAGGFDITDRVTAGLSLKRHSLDTGLQGLASPDGFSSMGTGWSMDAGLLLTPGSSLRVGVIAQDVGDARIEYENGVKQTIYPTHLRLGTAYRANRQLLLSGGLDEAAHLGGEYRLHPALTLRGGLQRDLTDPAGYGLTFGGGVRYRFTQVDYAFTDSPGLGVTHRFSLSLAFNLGASAVQIQDPQLDPVFPALKTRYRDEPVGRVPAVPSHHVGAKGKGFTMAGMWW